MQEVYDYLKGTPGDKWTRHIRTDRDGNHCALGWIDLNFGDYNSSEDLLGKLISYRSVYTIVEINNKSSDPKEAVLEYIEKLLKNR